MPLSPGTRLGVYEIGGAIGAGGMGEVYLAHDTALGRDVALKILPESFAADPDRLMRFAREAQALAALNHPNIAQVYAVERSIAGPAIVMELVEGRTLEEIIRAPLPADEALAIARQIADALEAAHEKGIIHRDLKPANVKVTPAGTVKVLDFGLAKAVEGDGSRSREQDQSPSLATMTSPAMTAMGLILGTAAYMAPEQAKGRLVDRRADIWAFGVVLYEMLTGRRAFAAEDVSDTLAAVLTREIDLAALPASTPVPVRRLLARCLVRDPRNRLRDIGDARLELDAAATEEATPVRPAVRFASRPAVALMAALTAVAATLIWVQLWRGEPSSPRGLIRTSIALPPGHVLVAGPEITRNGHRVAFVSTDGVSRPQLYTRRLDEPELHMLPGTEEADMPFFSPDGRWIAFYARGGFFKVRVDGGDPVRLADAPSGMGGHWLEDGTIIFTTAWNSGLYRINANGGDPEPLLIPDRKSFYAYTWPFVLPGERAMLFSRWGATSDLMRLDFRDMSQSIVVRNEWRRSGHTASGHIIFTGGGGDLLALPADPSLSAVAAPEPLLPHVAGGRDPDGYTRTSVSAAGTLVYAPLDDSKRTLVFVDSSGKMTAVQGPQGSYEELNLSPDGQRVVFTSVFRLFVHDLVRGSRLPLAPELPQSVDHPHWTADGTRVVFASNHGGTWDLYAKTASGAGDVEVVFRGPFDQYPTSVMRDGTVVYEESHDTTAKDIWLVPPGGDPRPWLVTQANEGLARVSPDDRIMAFNSNVSGRYEVYVQPVDRSSDAVAVSTAGGTSPVWSPSGDRLFFREGRRVMVARVTPGASLQVSVPEVAVDAGWALGQEISSSYYRVNYAVMPDGRFLMARNDPEAMPMRVNVIFNWFDELRAKVPVR